MQEQINNSSMLKVGTILRGTYRIDSYLSSGGFGNTYVATNIEFDERVAIKEFFMKGVTQRADNQTTVSVSNSENHNSFLEQKEKFKKEARRLRKLNNEYIVSVHDLFEENGTAYYVMDYVDGENLAERLKRTGKPMTEAEVNQILPQILDALKSIHDAGIWHLDLKPANIMVDKSGNVKLIDFGASKQLNAQKGGATTSTAISYTNGYAPREQMEQNYDKFGPWTDIYALGATLYSLLTNKRPPLPTDIDDDSSEGKHNSLPFPESISREMKSLILWMMHTNRNQRPQDVDSVLSKLACSNSTKIEDDIDESTILERTNNNSSHISFPTRKRNHFKYYIVFSVVLSLCAFIGVMIIMNYNTDEKSRYKPKYKVIDEKEKTCELFGEEIKHFTPKSGFDYDTWSYWNLEKHNFACIPDTASGNYIIPSEVDGYKVIRLGILSFYNTQLTKVTIPPSVKSIGEGAFSACKHLSSISIPEGIEVIPKHAFGNCHSLYSVHLPSTIKCIKDSAFIHCGKLALINIPEGVEEISMRAFCYTSLPILHFPRTIKTIVDGHNPLIVDDSYYTSTDPVPVFSRLKKIISDIPDPFAVIYKHWDSFSKEVVPDSFHDLPNDAILYIPKGSKELYIKAGWTKFFSQVIEQ